MSAFSTSTGSNAHINLTADDSRTEEFDPNQQKMSDKAADQKKLIEGTADTCFSPSILKSVKQAASSTCYDFDKDIKIGLGSVDGEACLVSYARGQMTSAIGKVDQVINMIGAMLCQAKKANSATSLPAIGATLDLKTTMGEAIAANKNVATAPTITTAGITRLADSGTHAVYRTDLTYTNGTNVREVHLVNSPGDTSDEFTGTLWISDTGGSQGAPGGGAQGNHVRSASSTKTHFLSVTYSKSGTTTATQKLVYEVREAQINPDLGDPFTEAGQLDYNVGALFTGTAGSDAYGTYSGYAQANQAIDGIHYLSFEVNPNTNEGNFAFWVNPGGDYYENARGMIFNISAKADGTLSGCGASGSAGTMGNRVSIRRSIKEPTGTNTSLTPRGYYHPTASVPDWIPSEVSSTQNASKIYQQCFTQNATTGLYAIDTTKTTDTTNNFDIIATAALTMAPPNTGAAKPIEGFKK